MGSHVLEYVIKATDATGKALSSATQRVKKFTSTVVSSMSRAKSSMDMKDVEEKFIHTSNVLDEVGKRIDKIGVSGNNFSEVMDNMENALGYFNKSMYSFDDLVQHFTMSMQDVGMSEKDIASGVKMLNENLIKTSQTGGAEALGKFNALRAVTAALRGDFGMLTNQLAKLFPAFKAAGAAGVAAGAAWAGAVIAIISLLRELYYLFKEVFNLKGLPRDLADASGKLFEMKETSKQFYDLMEESRENAKTLADQYEDAANAINDMTKAQNEFNRAQELSLAKSDEERASINARYDASNKHSDENTAANILANQRKDAENERERLDKELWQSLEDQKKYLAENQRLLEKAKGYSSWGWNKDRKMATLNAATNASNAYYDAVQKEDDVRKKIAENDALLKVISTKEKSNQLKSDTRKQQDANKASDKQRKFLEDRDKLAGEAALSAEAAEIKARGKSDELAAQTGRNRGILTKRLADESSVATDEIQRQQAYERFKHGNDEIALEEEGNKKLVEIEGRKARRVRQFATDIAGAGSEDEVKKLREQYAIDMKKIANEELKAVAEVKAAKKKAEEAEKVYANRRRKEVRDQIEDERKRHEQVIKNLDDEIRNAEEKAAKWKRESDHAVKLARGEAQDDSGKSGFSGWRNEERDKEKAEEKAKKKSDREMARNDSEIERLQKEAKRGKAFNTPQLQKELAQRIKFRDLQDPTKNPGKKDLAALEEKKTAMIEKMKDEIVIISDKLKDLGI